MSGGIAYVHDPTGVFPSLVNYEMVDLEPLDDDDTQFLLDVVTRHRDETGSAVAERLLAAWDDDARGVPQGHAEGLQARARGDATRPRSRTPRVRDARAGDGVVPWVTSPAFSSGRGAGRRAGPSPCACSTGTRSTSRSPRRSCGTRPVGAWTAASRSATTAARSATSSPTGTTSSTATAGARRSSGSTRRTTSPSSPAGCAPRRARPRACSASTAIR